MQQEKSAASSLDQRIQRAAMACSWSSCTEKLTGHVAHALCTVLWLKPSCSHVKANCSRSSVPHLYGSLLPSPAVQGWRQQQACLVAWQAVSAAQVHHRTWRLGCCLLTWHAWAARQSALRQSLETLLALKKVSRVLLWTAPRSHFKQYSQHDSLCSSIIQHSAAKPDGAP